MKYDFKTFDVRGKDIVSWLEREFSGVRTGRATPALLDLVQVESYGARVPVNQVGSVNIEDPRTLRIVPWDSSIIKAVEKGIMEADLGISVSVDSAGLRITFPELTSERRDQLLKLAKSKLEEARVSLRGARDEAMKEIGGLEKTGDMSKDECFTAKEDLQKRVDTFNSELGGMFEKKETEIQQ